MKNLPKDKHALVIQGSEEEKQQACIEIIDWAIQFGVPIEQLAIGDGYDTDYPIMRWGGKIISQCANDYPLFDHTIHHTVESFVKVFEVDGNLPPSFEDVIEARIKYFNSKHHTYEGSELQQALNTIKRLVPPDQFKSTIQ